MTVAAMRYVLSRIAEALGCSPDEDEELVEVAGRLVAERDEARDEHDKVVEERERAHQACNAYWHDLERIASLCERTADEYPLKAVERTVRERDEARAEVERLRADLARCREVQKATAEGWRHEVAEIASIVGAPPHTAELAACVRAEVERLRREREVKP